ncbi:protein AMBP-like isoform X2 [Stigmatopora argus]
MSQKRSLLFLLVVQWMLFEASVIFPQQNFDLEQFKGRWYEVAVVSDCPFFMRNKKLNPVIVTLDVKPPNILVTAPRNGSCKQTHMTLTDIAGQFFYHVARLNVDVDAYVVRSDYEQYAMMALSSVEVSSQNKTTIFKLFSRSLDVRQTVLNDFKSLVRTHEMRDDEIILNEKKLCSRLVCLLA